MEVSCSDGQAIVGEGQRNFSLVLSPNTGQNTQYLGTVTSGIQEVPQIDASNLAINSSSATTTTGGFLVGVHSMKSLEETNLPDFVKEHSTTLSFPEKLMLLLTHIEKDEFKNSAHQGCIEWVLNGRAFIIRDRDAMVKQILPLFFKEGKFASFTRKLYRWGFRQVNVGAERIQRGEMIFSHGNFQRDNKHLMVGMRSITAAGRRRAAATKKKEQDLVNSIEGMAPVLADPSSISSIAFQLQRAVAGASAGTKRIATEDLQASTKRPSTASTTAIMGRASGQLGTSNILPMGGFPGGMNPAFPALYPPQGVVQASDELTRQYMAALSQVPMSSAGASQNINASNQTSLKEGQKPEGTKRMHTAIDLLLRYS